MSDNAPLVQDAPLDTEDEGAEVVMEGHDLEGDLRGEEDR